MNRGLIVGAGWMARGGSIIFSLINTRLMIDLLGIDGYATTAILISFSPWLALLNLGLPNAIQNQIAHARANGNKIQEIQNTAITLSIAIAIFSIPISGLIAVLLQNNILEKQHPLPMLTVTAIVWSLIANGLTAIFTQILLAHHRNLLQSIAPTLQSALMCIILSLAIKLGKYPSSDIAIATVAPTLLIFSWLAIKSAKIGGYRFKISQPKKILYSSRNFFAFSLISTIAMASDYLVMSQLLTGKEIAQYNIINKCLTVIISLQTIVLSMNWTSISDLYFTKKLLEIPPKIRKLLTIGFGIITVSCIPLAFGLNHVTGLISGNTLPEADLTTITIAIACALLRIWTDTYAMILMSCNKTKIMNSNMILQSILAISLQWTLGKHFGVQGIFAGTALSLLLTASWILPLGVSKLISKVN